MATTQQVPAPERLVLAAQERVNQLLEVQRQLHSVLSGNGVMLPDSAGPGNGGTPHSSGLRHLLGRAVRLQTDQQRDLDALRDSVSEARVNAWSATQKAAASSTASIEATERGDKLEAELAAERNERMESEAAALEREEELQAKIDELEEKERRRVELQKALDDAEAMEAPAMPAASIAVVAKPPPPPPPGMNMAAGGFEL